MVQVTMEAEIKPETDPLTLFVSTYAPKQEVEFIVTVYSTAPLVGTNGDRLRLIPADVGSK